MQDETLYNGRSADGIGILSANPAFRRSQQKTKTMKEQIGMIKSLNESLGRLSLTNTKAGSMLR
jgi:hypothetical protein